ncbi:MAG: hypothetical protein NVSMB9_01190 [Isosphaeraceae bacterium]
MALLMTQPETPESLPSSSPQSAVDDLEIAEETGAEEPEPQPWTEERVTEWNAYYDLYVLFGVLLLTFIASTNKITHSAIWSHLQTGRVIAGRFAPVLTDLFSYTQTGQRWINISWLFDWSHALLYKVGFDLAPIDPSNPVASAAKGEQFGAGGLVILSALMRMLTALLLLTIRREGPGRWWSGICVALALGAMLSPGGVVLGGIAGPGIVGPTTWGIFFLALEIWLIHRAVLFGRRQSLYGLIPLFVLWANVDATFFYGLMVLLTTAVGRLKPGDGDATFAPAPRFFLGIFAACVLACVVNPSTVWIYRAAISPLISLFGGAKEVSTFDQLSYFGPGIRQSMQAGEGWRLLLGYYLIFVAVGIGSFVLNRKRFNLSRFLSFALAAVLWGTMIRFGPEFAVVFAVTLALNGQEWYLDRFGAEGRLGMGWSIWSVGGRAVTIVLVFACVAKALTSWGMTPGEPRFGLGFEPSEFAFEAADYLKGAPIKGNVLNTLMGQGDALIWRAYPARRTYVDSRQNLFPASLLSEHEATRRALKNDDVEAWKPLLDLHDISVVLLNPSSSPQTYSTLSQSPNWLPFYDDGNAVMFGRLDASAADVAYFESHRLDPDLLAYKRTRPIPSADRPPSPVDWMDTVFQTRAMARPQPHTDTARRWLSRTDFDAGAPGLPEPARCLLAIGEARIALASRPDDPAAFRVLATAYKGLMLQEQALMAGLKLTPEYAAQISRINPQPNLLMTRFRQRATALNYAIQTTPPPKTLQERRELQVLNLDLFQLWISVNYLDLARDRLQAVLDNKGGLEFPENVRVEMTKNLAQLDDQVKQIQTQMSELTVEQQYGPLQLASFAISQGAPGLAIAELKEADQTGSSPTLVKPRLLDLYCDTGQPEKAVEMLSTGSVEDPAFGSEPGVSPMRQGRTYFQMGSNADAAVLWENYAIPRLRSYRAMRALGATQNLLKGEGVTATSAFLEIPEKIKLQASWEFEVGLCRLEGGSPKLAADHFTEALTLVPRLNVRPIIAYYLEKMGKPVPPLPKEETAAVSDLKSTTVAPKNPEAAALKKDAKEPSLPNKE